MGDIDIAACDFAFRAREDDGSVGRYDALFYASDPALPCGVLVYADAEADEDGDVGTYASVPLDPAQVAQAQASYEAGARPKKPPMLTLRAVEAPEEQSLLDRALEVIEQEEDDEA